MFSRSSIVVISFKSSVIYCFFRFREISTIVYDLKLANLVRFKKVNVNEPAMLSVQNLSKIGFSQLESYGL